MMNEMIISKKTQLWKLMADFLITGKGYFVIIILNQDFFNGLPDIPIFISKFVINMDKIGFYDGLKIIFSKAFRLFECNVGIVEINYKIEFFGKCFVILHA